MAMYNLHFSSLETAFLAKPSRNDVQFDAFRRFCAKTSFFLGLLSSTRNSSKSSPNCFLRVTKQSNSIMAARMMVKGKQKAAKTTGKIMAWIRSLESVFMEASMDGMDAKFILF